MKKVFSRELTKKEKWTVVLIFTPVALILIAMLVVVAVTWTNPQADQKQEGTQLKHLDL